MGDEGGLLKRDWGIPGKIGGFRRDGILWGVQDINLSTKRKEPAAEFPEGGTRREVLGGGTERGVPGGVSGEKFWEGRS